MRRSDYQLDCIAYSKQKSPNIPIKVFYFRVFAILLNIIKLSFNYSNSKDIKY
jgi:hypothetical protein